MKEIIYAVHSHHLISINGGEPEDRISLVGCTTNREVAKDIAEVKLEYILAKLGENHCIVTRYLDSYMILVEGEINYLTDRFSKKESYKIMISQRALSSTSDDITNEYEDKED